MGPSRPEAPFFSCWSPRNELLKDKPLRALRDQQPLCPSAWKQAGFSVCLVAQQGWGLQHHAAPRGTQDPECVWADIGQGCAMAAEGTSGRPVSWTRHGDGGAACGMQGARVNSPGAQHSHW